MILAKWLTGFMLAVALFCNGASVAQAQPTPIKALILYDQVQNNPYEKLGLAYAIMVRNLLGHWNTTVTFRPTSQYTAGLIEQHDKTFYLGSHYDNQLPPAFVTDVLATSKTVVWFKYNLWQIAWPPAPSGFSAKFGFDFQTLRGMNAAPTPSNPSPGFFDTVTYKNRPLKKYYAYNSSTGAISADPDIGVTTITNPAQAQVLVSISNPTGEQVPYVVRGGNLWYFADLPLSFIGPRDRYLVLCDILHDILGVQHAAEQKALVRLEDVSALVSPTTMRQLSDYLFARSTPFSVAVIPWYRDPLGKYNGGVPQQITLQRAPGLRNALTYAIARGGKLVLHGYSHQYNSMLNPHTGVSGDDYEFWDIVNNRAVAEDSVAYASKRITDGKNMLAASNFTAFAWEPPHYQSSPLAYKAAAAVFPKTWQRAVYYTSDVPNLAANAPNRDFAVGQFFPYIIQKDYYNQRIIPENLGNIEYDIREIDPTSNFNYTWEDLKLNAENAKVIRDGFASFFFHPFWLEPAINRPGLADFKKVMEAIDALGFQFVDASTLP